MASAIQLIRAAKDDCESVAMGPFTPVVFERYEYIGGKRGIRLGFLSSTLTGASCIVWI